MGVYQIPCYTKHMSTDTSDGSKYTFDRIKRSLYTSKRVIQLVWAHERNLLILSSLLRIVPAGLPFINAYIYKLIIDEVVHYINSGTVNQSYFYWLFFARTVSFFASDIASRIETYVSHHLWTRIPIVFQDMMLAKISHLDIQYFEDSEFKNLLEKSRDGLSYRPQNLMSSLLSVVEGFFEVVIASVALFRLNPYLIFIIALIAVPEFIVQTRLSNLAWGIWNWKSPMKKRYWDLLHVLQDARMIMETKLYHLQDKFLADLHQIQIDFYKEDTVYAKRNLVTQSILNIFSSISYIAIELYTVMLVFKKRITIGDIGFYTSVISSFRSGLSRLLRSVGDLFDATLYIETVFEILDTEPLLLEPANPVHIANTEPPLIEFRHVDFTYPGTTQKILDDFSLTIYPQQKIALVGENGAGKSTIVKLIARLYDVTSGEILINGTNIKDISMHDWRRCLGILYQHFNKYNYTVKENIWFGDITQKPSQKAIRKAAHDAAADTFIKTYKQDIDQMLGRTFDDGIEPSGGQWQKIAISRAFFRNAPILILDEPTAAIDARAEAEIFERVEELTADKSTIIISHRFSTVRRADRIYVIENGKIIEQGSHRELMKLKGQYERLFSLQAKGYE